MLQHRCRQLHYVIASLLVVLGLLFAGAARANISANILFYQSRFADLEVQMEQEIKDLSKAQTSDLLYLCAAYFQLKKYNKLFPCLDQWERNAASGDVGGFMVGGDITWMLHVYRAEASIEIGDYQGAVRHAKFAYDYVLQKRLSEKNKFFPLAALSLAYALNGDREKALEHARLLDSVGDTLSAMLSVRLVGLAKVYLALGDFEKCTATMHQESGRRGLVGAITHSIGVGLGQLVFHELPKYFIASKCLFESGDIQQAKGGYDSLLAYPQTATMGGLYWQILFDRGRIDEVEGRPEEAINFYRQAIEVIERQRSTINTEASKIGFVGDKQAVYRHLVSALLSNKDHAAAFEYVERSKSRALVDMLAAKQDFSVTTGDPARIRTLLAAAKQAEAELLVQGTSQDKSSIRSAVSAAHQQLSAESPELASLVSVSSLKASEVQSRIPPDETLVEYYLSGDDLIAFILTSQELHVVRLQGTSLLDSVSKFREAIEDVATQRYLDPAKRLFEQLIRPIASRIGSSKLIIVAHGPLHYLPFYALHDGKGFLIDLYSLRILPSASVIKYFRGQPIAKPGDILAFGNPDLGDPRMDLENAEAEAIAVTKGRSESKVLIRKEANEAAFRQFGEGFRYIHFATHGIFNAEAPLKSALLLAKDAESNGLLTVDKLYSTKLDADLVTLSACETGLGRIASGDDVVGLSRGFLYAGSRSIVASLWKVDDLATSHLMTQFYEQLKLRDKREALRQAQRETMKKFPHPYFWAAFQLTGSAL